MSAQDRHHGQARPGFPGAEGNAGQRAPSLSGDDLYRRVHPDHYGENWPYLSEAHRPSLARDTLVGILIALIVGGGLLLAGAAIARVVEAVLR